VTRPKLTGPAIEPPIAKDHATVDEIGREIIRAARDEFVRFGIRRANMEEIARRAGVARVTVYRRFNSKPTLLRAVVMADIIDFVDRFDAMLFSDAPIADRLVDTAALSINELRQNALIVTTLRSDPDTLLSALTLDGQSEFESVKNLLSSRISRLIDRGDIDAVDAGRRAELTLRLIYTTVLLPFGELPGRTDEEVRTFAREFITPLLINNPPSS
jgi:AcrR family transcriptional regulator